MDGVVLNTERYLKLSTASLIKAEWNYKTNNPEILEKLKENIKKNGQIENILVRELGDGTYEVVNGNHRLDAFVELGIEEIFVFNLGSISENQAKRIAVETNETHFENDHIKLSELMATLAKEMSIDDLTKTMPYSKEEIERMVNLTDFDWNKYNGTGDAGEPLTGARFEVTVENEDDVIIEQEIQTLCERYQSAKYRRL